MTTASGTSSPPHLITGSIRGPARFRLQEDLVRYDREPSSVSNLIARELHELAAPCCWVASIDQELGKRLDAVGGAAIAGAPYRLSLVPVSAGDMALAYDRVATRMLWYANHGLWPDLPPVRYTEKDLQAFRGAFQTINHQFARTLAGLCRFGSVVITHDYQLATTPALFREWDRRTPLAHMSYTPFADASSLSRLPLEVSLAVCRGMLGADLLGFTSPRWAARFLSCAESVGGMVDHSAGAVEYLGRRSWVRIYPVWADSTELLGTSRDRSTPWAAGLASRRPGPIIARAERLDPAKNALRSFDALELVLDRMPAMRGVAQYVVCFVPTREAVPEYQWYAAEVRAAVARINRRYPGTVQLHVGDDRERALGILSRADVIVVNSVLDGMNLIAEEAVLVNRVDGVLVLSAGVGCADFLGEGAVVIEDPRDVESTANALETALTMSSDERGRRAAMLRAAVSMSESRLLERLLTDLGLIEAGSDPETAWPAGTAF